MVKIFTDEARIMYDKFMKELKHELSQTEMPSIEQRLTFEDVERQITDICEFKEDEVIGTDTLRIVLNKVGTPKQIVTALDGETKFANTVQGGKSTGRTKTLDYSARDIVKFMKYNHTILLALFIPNLLILIWGIVDVGYDEITVTLMIVLFPMLLMFGMESAIIHDLARSRKLFSNEYLFRSIQPNGWIFFLGIIFLVTLTIYSFFVDVFLIAPMLLLSSIGLFTFYLYVNAFYSNKSYYFNN